MKDEGTSLHGDLRLMQRTGRLDITVTELWENSIPCQVKHRGYDEARVSPEHGVTLLKKDGQVVTVLPETHNVTVDGDDFEEYLDGAVGGE